MKQTSTYKPNANMATVDGTNRAGQSSLFRMGYIIDPRWDLAWFIGLPFLALAVALMSQAWLSAVVIASFALWFDIPHHGATFIRTFGIAEDRRRFRQQLIVGGLAITAIVLVGLKWAPLTLVLVSTLWNHQHQLMQLHGFSRIYDFKAQTGTPTTPRWDLGLACVLYGNLFLTAPLFARFWIRELHRFQLPISADGVRLVQQTSWCLVAFYLCLYLAHILQGRRQGYGVNPIKYAFIASNYAVLYVVCHSTASILVYSIANVIMHGVQYIVFVYVYMQRKSARETRQLQKAGSLWKVWHVATFVGLLAVYAIVYQLIKRGPLEEFSFGLLSIMAQYPAISEVGLASMSPQTRLELLLLVLISVPGMLHLYYDSFIWKVRDRRSQVGL